MDRKSRKDKHKKNRKYSSSSSSSRPSSSVSISVSKSSSISEKIPRYRPRNHDNMVLLIENLPENVTKQLLDERFTEAAMEANVIPHEEISIINAFGQAYIKYCTVDYARKVLINLKGHINIGEHSLSVDFYDDASGTQRRTKNSQLKNSLINQPPTSYDWICDKCGYENFAKRHKCNKCLNPRNINCKILSVMMAPPAGFADDSLCNTSLMIKAKSIADATESEILDIFQPLASVKDIRLVKNKIPKDPRMKEQKDFAFVEFFSVEDAENVFRFVTQNEVRLHGDQLIIQYSRNNRASRFDEQKQFQFVAKPNVPNAPTKEPEVQIVQPNVQAPYQCELLAQERIITKSENKQPTLPLPKLLSQFKLPTTTPPIPKQIKKKVVEEIDEESEEEVVVPPIVEQKPKVEVKLTEAQIRKKAELELKKWEKAQQNKKVEQKIEKTIAKINAPDLVQRFYLCPICRRKFQNEEVLTYHVVNSELHKQNLIKLNI